MPITGRIYDRIGPRWPATIGLMIATAASYLLHTITLDTSRGEIMWMLVLQYGGLGIGMMPIFSAGLAVIPATHASIASALNNVVQRVAAAFGVAVFTTILTVEEVQLMAGRTALLPATALTPHLGPPGTPDWVGLYALHQQTHQQVFVGAIDDLFLLITALFALSALGALLLRSRPVTTFRHQATDLVTAQIELATKHEQVEQQRPRAEVAEQRAIQIASHIEHL